MAQVPLNSLIYGPQAAPAGPARPAPRQAPMPMMPSSAMQQQRMQPSTMSGMGGAPAQGGAAGFMDKFSAGFSDPLTQIGLSMLSNGSPQVGGPRPMFAGVPQAMQNAQLMQARDMEMTQAQEAKAAEAEQKRLLAEAIKPQLPANLHALADADPQSAMAMYEQMNPGQSSWDFMNVDGTIVRTNAATGAVEPAFQTSTGQPRPMSPEERAAWGIPETDTAPYYLGKDGAPHALGGSSLVTVNNGGATDKFYETMDARSAEQQAALIDAGLSAQSNNIRLSQLETHLANAPQGAAGAFAQVVGSMGIPTEGLDDLQAAQALISQMVPGQRPPGSGTMSDADLALFKQSLPAIINQPGGNAQIIATTKAINDYTIQQAEIARRVANREITPADGQAQQAAIPNPLANFNAGASGGGADGVAPQTAINPATGERLVLQNGQWVPAQ